MRYAVIMAGGSGTRLWPMSRNHLPKQLIPLIENKSLLQLAFERLEGLIPVQRRYVCAGMAHRDLILESLPELHPDRFLGEPAGRDTLNAAGFSAAVIGRTDPDAVVGVFTADHLISPVDEFQRCIDQGYSVAERFDNMLVTFGVEPTRPATGYGYLKLGKHLQDSVRIVDQFKEKPDAETALVYFNAGPERYLWNSGMFVWRTATLLECLSRYQPSNHDALRKIVDAWHHTDQKVILSKIYPGLKKQSVDYGVMEPASRDPSFQVAALPLKTRWLDVGSWASVAEIHAPDEQGNVASNAKSLFLDTNHTLVASSEPGHLIATLGCDDLVIVHTSNATLVGRKDQAERIKQLQKLIADQFGTEYI